jgi:cytochrome c553
MARVATMLTPADITAVATWLSSQPVAVGPAAADSIARPLPLACGSVPP